MLKPGDKELDSVPTPTETETLLPSLPQQSEDVMYASAPIIFLANVEEVVRPIIEQQYLKLCQKI